MSCHVKTESCQIVEGRVCQIFYTLKELVQISLARFHLTPKLLGMYKAGKTEGLSARPPAITLPVLPARCSHEGCDYNHQQLGHGIGDSSPAWSQVARLVL